MNNKLRKTLKHNEVIDVSSTVEQALYLDKGARYTTVDIDKYNKRHKKTLDVYKTKTPFTIQNKIHFLYPNVETRTQFFLDEIHIRVR